MWLYIKGCKIYRKIIFRTVGKISNLCLTSSKVFFFIRIEIVWHQAISSINYNFITVWRLTKGTQIDEAYSQVPGM